MELDNGRSELESGVAIDAAFGAGGCGFGHAFVGGLAGTRGGGVFAPDRAAGCAARVVLVESVGHLVGQEVAGGAFGLVVRGAWPVVVGQDHAEVVLRRSTCCRGAVGGFRAR